MPSKLELIWLMFHVMMRRVVVCVGMRFRWGVFGVD